MATDPADNWLHVDLAAFGVLVGMLAALGVSARREHRRLEREVAESGAAGGPDAVPAGRSRRCRFLRRTPDQQTAESAAAEREPAGTTETGRGEWLSNVAPHGPRSAHAFRWIEHTGGHLLILKLVSR